MNARSGDAKRRIDRALRLVRREEGDLRYRLAAAGLDDPTRDKLEAKLRAAVKRRIALEPIGPHKPQRIAVEDSELGRPPRPP